jgi:uncharacterized membrane protein
MTISSTGSSRLSLRLASAGRREAASAVAGAVVGAVVAPFTMPAAAILIGWDVAMATYLIWTYSSVRRLDPEATARLAKREDPSMATSEVLLLAAGVTMLAAVGFALVRAGEAAGGVKAYLITLGLLSVVLSWTLVHAVFGLRYARAYYSDPPGGIEFNESEPPTYTDFAYFAFTVGMTFQVSDTNITAKAIRRTTLHHALLSYLFGAVLLGLMINVVAALLK